MLKIKSGKISRAQKVVIYGPEGIGKSTFASKFPDPLFIDTEDSTAQLDIRRLETDGTWDGLIAIVKEVAATPDCCKTLVIDTADWAEQLCVKHILLKYKQESIESFGYGKGYTILGEEFTELLTASKKVIDAGINVVITAHAKMRKQELPDEAGAFDRWELKLSKQSSPLLKEWADLLLFLNYKTYVVEMDNKAKKAQGGKRVMYTSHSPVYDAKNRHGLPDVMDLDYDSIAFIFRTEEENKAAVLDEVRKRAEAAGVTIEQIQDFVTSQKHYPKDTAIKAYSLKFLTGWVLKYFDNIVDRIKNSADKETDNG